MTDESIVSWDGRYFGWIEGDALFTHDGRHVARVQDKEIFSRNGAYLGEIRQDRLITNVAKTYKRGALGFMPQRLRVLGPIVSPGDELSLDMPAGYQDFPRPETL